MARTPTTGPLAALLMTLAVAGSGGAPRAWADPAVGVRELCPAAAAGMITCQARVLVRRADGHLLRPRVGRAHRRPRASDVGIPAPSPMTPAYLQQAYDLTYLSSTRGTGDTVAVVGVFNDPAAAADLATFRAAYGLAPCTVADGCFQQLNQAGRPAPLPATQSDWAQEESMDIEAVSALCPNCRIDLVEASAADAQDLEAAIATAIAAGAGQVSISGDGIYTQSPFTDFSTPGVSVDVASGDSGALPSGTDTYPAALPYVTAVGGTTLRPSSPSAYTPRGIVETAWSGSSAGCDTNELPLPYQPADGCGGRMYADVSADGDPASGLTAYSSVAGGWFDGGGTSLAAPLVAAFQAVTGIDGSTPQWAYAAAARLNDPAAGSTGPCSGRLSVLCAAAVGYDGPTGAGSISGQVVSGAPGIGLPSFGTAEVRTDTVRVSPTAAWLQSGLYPNGLPTTYYWEYGPTTSYGARTPSASAGTGALAVTVAAHLTQLRPGTRYHYRLVASNPSGTAYGYDASLVTEGRGHTARHGSGTAGAPGANAAWAGALIPRPSRRGHA